MLFAAACFRMWPAIGAPEEPPMPGTGARDWPIYGHTVQRNMVSDETGLPDTCSVNEAGTSGQNMKWVATFGRAVYGGPVVANGKVYIGAQANDDEEKAETPRKGLGCLFCLDEQTGRTLWRFIDGAAPYGLSAAPVIEHDRVYTLGTGLQVFCLTANGLNGTNVGPFTDEEKFYGILPPFELDAKDADIVWAFNVRKNLPGKILAHNAYAFSPLLYGDYLYAATGNSAGDIYHTPDKPPAPLPTANADSACFMALDKKTGALVAVDDEKMIRRGIHGDWGMPSVGMVSGKAQILFGGADGIVYAFEPVARPAVGGKPGVLTKIWSFDPNQYVADPGPHKQRFEMFDAPLCVSNRVYVALSMDWNIPGKRRDGLLVCIDATRTGDITETGKIWEYRDIGMCDGCLAIVQDRLYATDYRGFLHCLDVNTGRPFWTYDIQTEKNRKPEIRAGAVVADGKVYFGSAQGEFYIFRDGKKAELLCRTDLRGEISAACAIANGTVYVAAGSPHSRLYAISKNAQLAAVEPRAAQPSAGETAKTAVEKTHLLLDLADSATHTMSAFLSWETIAATADGVRVAAPAGGSGGLNVALNTNLSAFAEWVPRLTLTVGPRNKLSEITLAVFDGDANECRFRFPLEGLAPGRSTTVLADENATLARLRAHSDLPDLNLTNVEKLAIVGSWQGDPVDLTISRLDLVKRAPAAKKTKPAGR